MNGLRWKERPPEVSLARESRPCPLVTPCPTWLLQRQRTAWSLSNLVLAFPVGSPTLKMLLRNHETKWSCLILHYSPDEWCRSVDSIKAAAVDFCGQHGDASMMSRASSVLRNCVSAALQAQTNAKEEPGTVPLHWGATARVCGRRDDLAKQTLWLIAFILLPAGVRELGKF